MNALTGILLGWVTYSYALLDIGRYSLTVLFVVSLWMAASSITAKRFLTFPMLLLVLSCVLAVVKSLLTYPEMEKTFTHLIRNGVAIGVLISVQSVDLGKIYPRFKRDLMWIGLAVFLYGIYQYIARRHGWPLAFLPITNQQLGADMGLQRGASNLDMGVGKFTRVSSFFPEPSDLGRFMLWVFGVGLAADRGRRRWVMMVTGLGGVLISQSLGAVVGVFFVLSVLMLVRFDLRKSLVILLVLAIVIPIVLYLLPGVGEMLGYRLGRLLVDRETYLAQQSRFAHVDQNLEVFLEAPFFGHGIASLKKIIPYNVIGNSWNMLLIERGLVGSLLFFAPFIGMLLFFCFSGRNMSEQTNLCLILLCIEVYCFSTFADPYFPIPYIALGFAIANLSSKTTEISQPKETRYA